MRSSATLRQPGTSWRAAPARPATRQGRARNHDERGASRWVALTVGLVLVPAALLLLSALVAGRPPADGEIERGVRVAGVPVEGDTWQQAARQLEARYAAYLDEPLILHIGDLQAVVTPADLGIAVDMDATLRRAQGIGRGPLVAAAGERLRAHLRGVDLDPVVTIDAARFYATLEGLSAPIIRAPSDARYAWQGGQIAIVASAPGVGVDTDAAAAALRAHVADLNNGPLEVPVVALPPAVTTDDLKRGFPRARELAEEPLVLVFDGVYWELEPVDLVELLVWDDGTVAFDRAKLTAAIGSLAASIDRDAVNATVVSLGDGTFDVVPEQDERRLDVAASVAAVIKAADTDTRQTTLIVDRESPPVTSALVAPLRDRANAIVARGIAVTWPEGEQWLDPLGLAETLRFDEINGVVTFDHLALAALIEPIADAINRPAAGLRWRNGVLVSDDSSEPGRIVDLGASANAIASAALGGQDRVALVINQTNDPAHSASEIVIREMLASASTYYGSSSTNRRTNIELAAAALDGALVAPGGVFSFNNAIGGTATLEDGYQMGFGIITGADGTPRTVPSVAGGICQVATTVFQSAFWAGMPIGERNWHLYWIPNYGTGPGGMVGLDATVDPDYGLDFTFVNPTSDWLAIRAIADGEWLTVELWGTNQGWQVHVDPPLITNVIKTDPTPRRQFSDQLRPGEEVVVEHAEDGFTATIRRVVTKDGQVVSETTLTSYYLPSHNVTLVGPGVPLDEPTPTPEPTPAPEETPTSDAPVEETPTDAPAPEETPAAEETPVEEPPAEPEATPSVEAES